VLHLDALLLFDTFTAAFRWNNSPRTKCLWYASRHNGRSAQHALRHACIQACCGSPAPRRPSASGCFNATNVLL